MTEATVRTATAGEALDALRILEGALLDVDAAEVRTRVADDDVLVAEVDDRIVGAAVLDSDRREDGAHIEAIAVTRRRRGCGIGTALVEAAADRHETLTAAFRPEVRTFWQARDFEIETAGSDGESRDGTSPRLRGQRE